MLELCLKDLRQKKLTWKLKVHIWHYQALQCLERTWSQGSEIKGITKWKRKDKKRYVSFHVELCSSMRFIFRYI